MYAHHVILLQSNFTVCIAKRAYSAQPFLICMQEKLATSEMEMKDMHAQLGKKDAEMRHLRQEMDETRQALAESQRLCVEKDAEFARMANTLRAEIDELQCALRHSQSHSSDLEKEIESLKREIRKLTQQITNDTRFKQYVDIRREAETLREHNENLLSKVVEYEIAAPPMSVIRRSGRVTSARGRLRGTPDMLTASLSQRPTSSRPTMRSNVPTGCDFSGVSVSQLNLTKLSHSRMGLGQEAFTFVA